jgi:hypothetical protein
MELLLIELDSKFIQLDLFMYNFQDIVHQQAFLVVLDLGYLKLKLFILEQRGQRQIVLVEQFKGML